MTESRETLLRILSYLENESHLFVAYVLIDATEELESPTLNGQSIRSPITNTFRMLSRMLPRLFRNNETNSIDDTTMETPNEFPLEPLESQAIEEQDPTKYKKKRGEIETPQLSVDIEENRGRALSEMAHSPPNLFSIEEDSDKTSNQAAHETNPLLGERRAASLEMFDEEKANLSDSWIRDRNPSGILTHTNSGSSIPSPAVPTQRRFFAHRPKTLPNKKKANKYRTDVERILAVVNDYMGSVIQNHKIEDLHDKNLAELLCYAFYGHRDTFAKWKECAAPLYSALLVIFVSETLWSHFDYIYESDIADIFMSQKKYTLTYEAFQKIFSF